MQNSKEIIMLPFDKCKVATIIKFKIKCLNKFCDASIVYFLPLEKDLESKLNDFNNIIKDALQRIECVNSKTIHFENRNILFEGCKNDILKCYINGRPQVKLKIYLTPNISIDDCYNPRTECIKGYNLILNININTLNGLPSYPLEIGSKYLMDYKDNLKWCVDNIETL